MKVPTVKIIDPNKPGDYKVINADDFHPVRHELFPGEDLPDTPLSRDRKKRNTATYHQACKDEIRSQDELRREFSVKASGILTFGVASLGVTVTLVDPGSIPNPLTTIMGVALALMVLAGAYILIPSRWLNPFSLSDLRKQLPYYEPENLVRGMGFAQEVTITKNGAKLHRRGMALGVIVIAAVVQTLSFIACLIYGNYILNLTFSI